MKRHTHAACFPGRDKLDSDDEREAEDVCACDGRRVTMSEEGS